MLMDAFDEIDPALTRLAIDDIETICGKYPDTLQIIITSRPDADIQRSSRFRVCKLAPLGATDHLPFLKKICAEKEQADSLMKVLQSSSTEIRDLLTTPLMLTLLVILYKSLQTVPDTVPKFYEELFDVLFYRHDHSKPGFRRKRFTQLDDSKIKKLFSAFCFYVRLEGLGVLTSAQLNTCVAQANKACNESVDAEKFRDEITKTVCLIQQDGFEYAFIHKSVTQYYAASFVRGSSDEFAAKFYQLAAKPGQSWDLELRFLAQIDTYRYTRLHEMPLLRSIAMALNYSFDLYDESAESRLNDHLSRKISLVMLGIKGEEPGDDAVKGREIVAWSHVVSDEDPVLNVLGPYWARQILLTASTDQAFKEKLINSVATNNHQTKNSRYEDRELTLHMADTIFGRIPELGKYTLGMLQERYQSAMTVLDTEEAKTAMLAALL